MVASKFTEAQTLFLIDLVKDDYKTLVSAFSSSVTKHDKNSAWKSIEDSFRQCLHEGQSPTDYTSDKLKKKWENLLLRLPTYVKSKNSHISSTGQEPFQEKIEYERILDVVGRDNPKYFKPTFGVSSTAAIFTNPSTSSTSTSASSVRISPTSSSPATSNVPILSSTSASSVMMPTSPSPIATSTVPILSSSSSSSFSKPSMAPNSSPLPPPKRAKLVNHPLESKLAYSRLIESEDVRNSQQHEVVLEYLQAKTEAQNAKRDYYIFKRDMLKLKYQQ